MLDIKELFDLVASRGASDLLLTMGAPPMVRVDGKLYRTKYDILTQEETKRIVYSVLTDKQKRQYEEDRELDFSLGVSKKYRYRVNVYQQKGCVAAAFRPIPEEIPSLEELGVPKVVSQLAFRPQGLVLVTGPTGHGKTTTQASVIDLINNNKECHIITIEDPIEYVHNHKRSIVDQREVGEDTETFQTGLKFILRQDPDVILVGEMRDLPTMEAALTAAETGHLVLATLHTNDAVQTVDRVIDVFPAHQQQQIRFQLSMCLLAVVSQRLLPRAEGTGRVLAVEIMRSNAAVANLIRENKTHQMYSVIETHAKDGMVTMDSYIKELYLSGIVSYDDAINNVKNPQVIMNA